MYDTRPLRFYLFYVSRTGVSIVRYLVSPLPNLGYYRHKGLQTPTFNSYQY